MKSLQSTLLRIYFFFPEVTPIVFYGLFLTLSGYESHSYPKWHKARSVENMMSSRHSVHKSLCNSKANQFWRGYCLPFLCLHRIWKRHGSMPALLFCPVTSVRDQETNLDLGRREINDHWAPSPSNFGKASKTCDRSPSQIPDLSDCTTGSQCLHQQFPPSALIRERCITFQH